MDAQKIAEDNFLFYTLSGSHAYGMSLPTSDKDYRGIFYSPKEVVISAFKNIEQVEMFGGEKDSVIFEIKKFVKLLSEQNPNILELLWVDDEYIQHITEPYKILREKREFFLSSKAKHTFSGYAMAQLKRIRGHNKWINNPQPLRRPKEIDFVSVVWNQTTIKQYNKTVPFKGVQAWHLGNDLYGLFIIDDSDIVWHDIHEALVAKPVIELVENKSDDLNFDLIVKFNKQLYKEAVDNWQHYWTWKKERNAARSELEEKYGYDTKHAAHLIRLLRMGVEILKGEGVKVYRPDAAELLSIRGGAYTYEQVVAHAEELDNELQSLYATTKLPFKVDENKADEILRDVYYLCWLYDSIPPMKASAEIGYKYYSKKSTNL